MTMTGASVKVGPLGYFIIQTVSLIVAPESS